MSGKHTFDTVRKLGLALPEVEDGTADGSLALKVRGKLMACIAIHKSAEPGSLLVRVDFDQREAMIAEAPDIYYVTEHYVNYPSVLVRLSRIDSDALRGVLRTAWQFVTATTATRKRPSRRLSDKRVRK